MSTALSISPAELRELASLGRQKPVRWIRHTLGVDLWDVQRRIAHSVRDNRNTLVDSCHGIGKTRTLASVGLQFLFTYPNSRVIVTAPTYRQVKSLYFAEVNTLHSGAAYELGGNLIETELEITDGWYLQGLSTNKPDRFQGQHAPYILFIVDEGYGVHPSIFEAIRGGMSSGHVRLLVAGNPTDPGAWIAEASRKTDDKGRKTWNHIVVSAFDTPNFTALGIAIEDMRSGEWREKHAAWLKAHRELPRPYLINPEFVAEALIEFGEDSPAWQSRVLGQLPSQATNTIIPQAWVEAAFQRWEHSEEVDYRRGKGELVDDGEDYVPMGDPAEIGVDVARFGDDDTVAAPRRGRRCLRLRVFRKQDGIEVAGLVAAIHDEMIDQFDPLKEGEVRDRRLLIKVDSNGLGVGALDPLRHKGYWAQGINVSEAPANKRKFADRTTELWWHLRELLNPMNGHNIALPRDNRLLGELTGRRYRMTQDDRLQVESKDDFKKRLGRSPDRADAVVLCFAPPMQRGNIHVL